MTFELISAPLPDGGIVREENGSGPCYGCGSTTTWYINVDYVCQRCQSLFAYRGRIRDLQVARDVPALSIWQHTDPWGMGFFCAKCPEAAKKCLNGLGSHRWSLRNNLKDLRSTYIPKFRRMKGWDPPRAEDCKCNGCAPQLLRSI